MKLTVFATTDIHGAIYPYDYFEGTEKSVSLLHLKSHIDRYRNSNQEELVLTVDNGDILQGDVWSDYDFRHQKQLFVPEVINEMYDVIGLGNHEFNFGLDYLSSVYEKVEAEVTNANVDFGPHPLGERVKPYTIIEKDTEEGLLRIGFLNVVPTQIMKWDAFHLEGEVTVEDMRRTVEETAAEIKAAGADIIILLSHSGMSKNPEHIRRHGENQTLLMTMMENIDGIVFGHTHEFFPDEDFEAEIENFDFKKGTVNEKPMVQPGVSASHLGKLSFELEKRDGKWNIIDSKAQLIDSRTIPMDERLIEQYAPMHEQVLEYLSEPIGTIAETWHTYFSRVMPSKAVQVVAEAGKSYVRPLIESGEIEDLPILGFNAVTKAGRDGAQDFTLLEAGPVTLSAAIDLYKHTNSMVVIKAGGKMLKEWLEWSASQFNTPGSADSLLKPNRSKDGFPSYNFDTFFDLEYTFDISQPPRYSGTAKKINDTERVVEMKYEGRPIREDDWFLVPANNYRVAYTAFLREAEIVHESRKTVRDIVIEYLRTEPRFQHRKPMTIVPEKKYKMMSSTKAKDYITESDPITYIEEADSGFSWYEIDLSKENDNDNSIQK